jgi:Methyltransferase domain
MAHLRSTVRELLPGSVLLLYRRLRRRLVSTEEVFTRIYVDGQWGVGPETFCSGSGSRESSIVSPYLTAVRAELRRLGAASMTAVDLGCGDFAVGRMLAGESARYIGLDIVRALVDYNRRHFGTERVAFLHANIVADELPAGDICFVRQVLQHLSNAQIRAVLPKLARYRWCFITEHHPSAGRLGRVNIDKPHGADIRIYRASGVYLEFPPFNVPKQHYRLILEVPGQMPENVDPGVIRTYLLEHPQAGTRDLQSARLVR